MIADGQLHNEDGDDDDADANPEVNGQQIRAQIMADTLARLEARQQNH